MSILLRPHHLLCLLTYVGKGYSEAFVRNFDQALGRLRAGEPATLVEGPDDLCRPLSADAGAHCHLPGVQVRDQAARAALEPLLGHGLAPGARVRLDARRIEQLRAAFAAGTLRAACKGCNWSPLCTEVAQRHFAGTRWSPAPAPHAAQAALEIPACSERS